MKKNFIRISAVLMVMIFAIGFAACKNSVDAEGVWEDAIYLKDTELGSGSKTVTVEVVAQQQKVTFTIKTDAETVGAALLENGIVEGENSEYGLYIKKVNGITADYNKDKAYWAFYIGGEYAMTGVDTTEIDEDAIYKLEYEK